MEKEYVLHIYDLCYIINGIMLAKVKTAAVVGLEGQLVEVEVGSMILATGYEHVIIERQPDARSQ